MMKLWCQQSLPLHPLSYHCYSSRTQTRTLFTSRRRYSNLNNITLQENQASQKAVAQIPGGSILQVVPAENRSTWLKMQVCQTPTSGSPNPSLSGKQGWINLEAIAPSNFQKLSSSEQPCEKEKGKKQ
ncbi:MAG: hypothetical protein HC820_00800 [Hydrococcus sp. RM1_1_31]|nr:hypothetical protein [Hydrococcus sp. RM1_1_31]